MCKDFFNRIFIDLQEHEFVVCPFLPGSPNLQCMKQILTALLFITGINTSYAQSESKHALYFSGELGYGSYLGLDLNMNYLYLEKYSLKVGYSGHLRVAESKPYDYSSGFFKALLYGLDNPFDQMENYQMAAGRIYKLNKKGSIRINMSIGIGFTTIREPHNWERSERNFLYENYTWDYEKYHTVSLIINPKIEFPFSRFYGISISPMVQFNKDRIYIGVGIGQMLGLLRNRNKPEFNED